MEDKKKHECRNINHHRASCGGSFYEKLIRINYPERAREIITEFRRLTGSLKKEDI